ncbi:MAG: hypothetical protein AABZ32_04165 [Bacteroidota bacterium]
MTKETQEQLPKKSNDEQEIAVHLKEYEMLAASIRTDVERIDKIIGIYAVAVFGIIAFFLKTANFDEFMKNIDKQTELIGLVLAIPIINAILLIHAVSSFQVILVKARCATYVIGEQLRSLLKRDVLLFDKIYDLDKQAWLNERTTVGIFYCLLSSAISLLILYRYSYVLLFSQGFSVFILWIASCFTVSLSLSFLTRHQFINKHFATLHKKPIREPFLLKLWILTSSCFIILFGLFRFFGYRTS